VPIGHFQVFGFQDLWWIQISDPLAAELDFFCRGFVLFGPNDDETGRLFFNTAVLSRSTISLKFALYAVENVDAPALAVPDEPPSYYTDNDYSPKSQNYKPFATHAMPLPAEGIIH
jgi:hypothetical protein